MVIGNAALVSEYSQIPGVLSGLLSGLLESKNNMKIKVWFGLKAVPFTCYGPHDSIVCFLLRITIWFCVK